jgi:uncharacterized protein YjbJ (UPF0337 family)
VWQNETNGGFVMTRDEFEGKWWQLRGAIREKWGDLLDDQRKKMAGKKEILVGKLQERYGVKREEAEEQLDEWMEILTQEPAPR